MNLIWQMIITHKALYTVIIKLNLCMSNVSDTYCSWIKVLRHVSQCAGIYKKVVDVSMSGRSSLLGPVFM